MPANLIFKLLLTPALIGLASLAGRRWGPAVSGWLVGLPLSSGPIVFFLALNQGSAFAAVAAGSTLLGTFSLIAFCLAYAWLARRWSWPMTLLASCVVFFATALLLQQERFPLALIIGIVLLLPLLALRLMPPAAPATAKSAVIPPRWDLPARMILATSFLLVLTSAATTLGPRETGIFAPFPLFVSILAAFAHSQQGPAAAARMLHGLLLGLFSFVSFFVVLTTLLVPLGTGPAFALASAVALSIQGATLLVMQRTG